MALFNIRIEKVIIQNDDTEVKKILQDISDKLESLLEDPTGQIKQQIFDKLNAAIEDIKQTV